MRFLHPAFAFNCRELNLAKLVHSAIVHWSAVGEVGTLTLF